MLEKAIREAAGACARVNTNAALHRNLKVTDGPCQLPSAFADIGRVQAAHRQGKRGIDLRGGRSDALPAHIYLSAQQIGSGFLAVEKPLLHKTAQQGYFFDFPRHKQPP